MGGANRIAIDFKTSGLIFPPDIFQSLARALAAKLPLRYTSPNAPAVQDVLGTWLLGILDGQDRYAQFGSLRGDKKCL